MTVKENEIYPKFEFRLSHEEKEWLLRELAGLHEKFNEPKETEGKPCGSPSVTKNSLIVAALRHGFRHLKGMKRL